VDACEEGTLGIATAACGEVGRIGIGLTGAAGSATCLSGRHLFGADESYGYGDVSSCGDVGTYCNG